jgi:hypothetical protein
VEHLLKHFGMATGLATNIEKSDFFPIRCDGLNIPNILGNFQVSQGQFSCKYLDLPLRIGKTKREDEQVLIDKVAGKLPRWKGKLLNKTGRLTNQLCLIYYGAISHVSLLSIQMCHQKD